MKLLLNVIDKLRTSNQRGNQTAPHKPLLLLYALRNPTAEFEFSEIEDVMKNLLDEFWKPPKSGDYKIENPFCRLQNDKQDDDNIWEAVSYDADGELRKVRGVVSGGKLRNGNAKGFFSSKVLQEIKQRPEIVEQAVQKLLNKYFPESLHADVRERVGLSFAPVDPGKSSEDAGYEGLSRRKRDPEFRQNVLHAYGYRCAVCGFNLQIKTLPVGLEAAHIKAYRHGGPNTEDNGLALCATHHKLLDSGVLTLSDDHRIILSKWVHSPGSAGDFIREHQERKIRLPRKKEDSPRLDYIKWHREEVFKKPAL